jgi:hypothetical protein
VEPSVVTVAVFSMKYVSSVAVGASFTPVTFTVTSPDAVRVPSETLYVKVSLKFLFPRADM